MKKLYFSGLISCGLLLAAAQTNGQSFEQNGAPVMVSSPDHAGLFAYPENRIIILRWSAGNEENIDRYIIERSSDSVHFTPLHELIATGANPSNGYQDIDAYPTSSANFYRMQTVLKTGGSFYSPVIRVDINTRDLPVLNPTVIHRGGTLRLDNYIYHESQPLTINFFNGQGTLVGSWLINGNSFTLNLDRLSTGILFYRISDQTHPLICAGKILIL